MSNSCAEEDHKMKREGALETSKLKLVLKLYLWVFKPMRIQKINLVKTDLKLESTFGCLFYLMKNSYVIKIHTAQASVAALTLPH